MVGWIASAEAAEVTLDGATWAALRSPPTPVFRPPDPIWARREATVIPVDGALRVESTWTVIVPEEAWVSVPLATDALRVRAVILDGRPSGVAHEAGALRWVGRLARGTHRLTLAGTVDGDPAAGPVDLALAPAAAGTVRFAVAGGVAGIPLGDGWFAGAAPVVRLAVAPRGPAASGTVARADVGLGVLLGEGVASLAARISWTVEQGALSEVAFDVPGAGPDLVVSGGDLASWSRTGDRVTVVLGRPAGRDVRVEARWTAPITGEVFAVPRVAAAGVRRTRASLQIARDGEVEPVPELAGWTAVPGAALPAWGAGLAPGALVGTWTAPANPGGRIGLLRFEPTGGPPAIVDVAEWTMATTEEGRLLLSGRLEVRNDRAAWLRVRPPAGASLVAARVDGRTAVVAGDADGWWIPLSRSVETVDGLLSFPVELAVLGTSDAWVPGANAVALPSLDAPVAVTRATLHLPPGWTGRNRVGEGHVVAAFSEGEGITYGLSSGVERQVADALYQSAVEAWKDNDFDAAEQALDQARALGADNENLRRLQGNVDLVTKSDEATGAAERRVLEQARARSFDEANLQEQVIADARAAELAGDYEAASEAYGKAKEIGDKLQRLDSSKVERGAKQAELDAKVTALEEKKRLETERDAELAAVEVAGELARPDDIAMVSRTEVSTARHEPLPPSGRSFRHAVETAAGATGGPAKEPDAPRLGPALVVTATTASVVVPAHGEIVRLQRLLLPPGVVPGFEIDARLPRRSR